MNVVLELFFFQPANVGANGPPGMVASMTSRLPAVVNRMRTPLLNGSNGGAYGCGSAISPLNLNLSSPGGVLSLVTSIDCPVAKTGMMLLHGSQASPLPSPSASAGQLLEEPSQLSAGSHGPAEGRQTAVLLASAGQAAPVPVQFSAGSHTPAEARHTVDDDWKASAGQLWVVPSQCSATSHAPADARQVTKAPLTLSAGQLGPLPVQCSATSQSPVCGRQTVVLGLNPSAGQLALEPVQFSALSQSPAEARHSEKGAWKASAGQTVLVPVQFSSASHGPADGRHTAPALPAGCWQVSLLPSH